MKPSLKGTEESIEAEERAFQAQSTQIKQLFARLEQEIECARPTNVIHFIVGFLCKHYPEHLHGFASIWNADPELERERIEVVEFFKAQKLPTEIASHFTSAGFDTLETLCTLTAESLDDIEKFNKTRWLPGHKVRLQQTFADIAGRVRAFAEERDCLLRSVRGSMYCHHPQLITKPNIIPSSSAINALPATSMQGQSCPLSQSSQLSCYRQSNPTYTTHTYTPALPRKLN